jgi:hypothetical protein
MMQITDDFRNMVGRITADNGTQPVRGTSIVPPPQTAIPGAAPPQNPIAAAVAPAAVTAGANPAVMAQQIRQHGGQNKGGLPDSFNMLREPPPGMVPRSAEAMNWDAYKRNALQMGKMQMRTGQEIGAPGAYNPATQYGGMPRIDPNGAAGGNGNAGVRPMHAPTIGGPPAGPAPVAPAAVAPQQVMANAVRGGGRVR